MNWHSTTLSVNQIHCFGFALGHWVLFVTQMFHRSSSLYITDRDYLHLNNRAYSYCRYRRDLPISFCHRDRAAPSIPSGARSKAFNNLPWGHLFRRLPVFHCCNLWPELLPWQWLCCQNRSVCPANSLAWARVLLHFGCAGLQWISFFLSFLPEESLGEKSCPCSSPSAPKMFGCHFFVLLMSRTACPNQNLHLCTQNVNWMDLWSYSARQRPKWECTH